MTKLFLDLDGVIINTNVFVQKAINDSGIDLTIEESFVSLCKSFPWDVFLQNCNQIKDSFRIVEKLNKIFDLTIITHCYSNNEEEQKRKFIEKNFADIKYITVPFIKMKNEVVIPKNSILVDDYYYNVEKWNASGGIGIYFNDDLNKKDCITINNLNQLFDYNLIEGEKK